MRINRKWKYLIIGVLAVIGLFLVAVGITCAKYGVDFKSGIAKLFGIAQQVAEQTTETATETAANLLV